MTTDLTREQIEIWKRTKIIHSPFLHKLCDMALKYLDTQPPKVAAPVDANGLRECPLPTCGGLAKLFKANGCTPDENTVIGYIRCQQCGLRTVDQEIVAAILYWNARPDSREPKAMREAEEWRKQFCSHLKSDCWGDYDDAELRGFIVAIQQDALQSKGCALPDEPTEEMINATNYENCEPPMARETVINIWNQMRSKCQPLPAAPQLPKD